MSEEVSEEGKSGGGGKMLLILGLVAGLGIGGAGVYFLLPSGEAAEPTEEKVDKVPENLVSVTFEQIAVPIYKEHRGQSRFIGNFFINFALNVDGDANASTVRRAETRLKHAFLSRIGQGSLMREDAPTELDYVRASAVLKEAAIEVVGGDIVHSVAVTEAIRSRN